MKRVEQDKKHLSAAKHIGSLPFGTTVTMDELQALLDCVPPEHGTFEDFKQHGFKLLAEMDMLRLVLLEDYKIYLTNIRGKGYLITHPKDQTGVAMDSLRTGIGSLFRKTGMALANIRHDLLTDDEARVNAEAIGRLAAVKSLTRKRLTN